MEEVKPSHIRKRNFGATFADAVDKAQAERLGEGNVLGRAKQETKDWVRVKTRPGAEAGLPGPSLTNTTEPRGRIKLRGSFLGIYSKGLATPRPPRTEEDVPQRPDKRERIRNLRIRRPFISDAGKPTTTSPTTTASTTTTPRAESTTTTTAGTSATAGRSSYSSPAPATVSVTSSERIINLAGVVKELEYKEIVRTSPAPAPAPSTSQATRAESSTGGGAATVSTSAATTPTTAATAESSSAATAAADGSQDDGLINIDTASQKSSSKNSETLPNLGSSENVISSTSELELEVAEGGSGASAAVEPSIQSATPSTTASSTVTESKELPGSSDIKQSKAQTQTPEPSLAQVDITTRNPIEIQRPREELQKDLLEAIRRKISRNKAASVATQAQAAAAQISGSQAENEGRSNFIASTKSPFYRPLSYVGSKKNASTAADSRVKIFINLPPSAKTGQDPTSVKIPNISHIRNKLERLNDAITEGLRLERQREEEAAARESDWRHGGAASSGSGPRAEVSSQRSVVKSQSSSVQIVSQHRGPAAAANSEAGNQETIRKQLVEAPSKTGTADIINQFEAATTPSTAPPPPPASTTAQSTTPIEDEATTSPAARNKEKPVSEHPSSHFRPDNWTSHDFIPMPKSNLPPKEDVQLFVVPKQQPAPARQPAATQNTTAREEAESQEQSGGQEEEEEEEVTNTTIMVISVVAVIPVAGLVAWAVRTVLRRKVNKPAQLKIFMCLTTKIFV